jgi:hypothetical protein
MISYGCLSISWVKNIGSLAEEQVSAHTGLKAQFFRDSFDPLDLIKLTSSVACLSPCRNSCIMFHENIAKAKYPFSRYLFSGYVARVSRYPRTGASEMQHRDIFQEVAFLSRLRIFRRDEGEV